MLRCGQLTAALLICSGCMLSAKATAGHAHASRGKPAAHRDVSRPSSIIKEEANSFQTLFRSIESPCPAGMEWHPATDTRPRRCMDVDECKDDSSLSTQVSLNDCNGNNFVNTQVRCLFFPFSFFPSLFILPLFKNVACYRQPNSGSFAGNLRTKRPERSTLFKTFLN